MPDAFDDIDLSEFGLDGPGDAQPVSTATPEASDEGISGNVLAELGLGDLEEPAAAVNGQASVPTMSETWPEPPSNLPVQVPNLKPGDPYSIPNIANLERQSTPPSTGFGILEQILLEVSRLNLEIAGLRQTLSTPGALGPSAQAQGAQRISSAPAAAGAELGDAPRPRRRGRPKKEEEQIELDM